MKKGVTLDFIRILTGRKMKPTNIPSLKTFLHNKDQRYIDSLLWVLHIKGLTTSLSSLGIKEDIVNCLHAIARHFNKRHPNSPETISEYLEECELQLIPKEYLDWLDPKDKRQCNFVWLTLESLGYFKEVTMLSSNHNSNKYAIIIKALDRSSNATVKKLNLITELKYKWKAQTSYKGFQYGWLSEKNLLQCEKALKFINKPPSEKGKSYAKPERFQDYSELSSYFNFLAIIDCWQAPLIDKEYFQKKIMDAARKWNTEKARPRKKNTVQVIGNKSLTMLDEITSVIGAKNKRDALDTLILEKHATLSTHQSQENAEELRLDNNYTESDNCISSQEYSEITSKLEATEKELAQLKEKALSQLKTMCEKIVRLEGSELVSKKLTKPQVRKINKKVEEKKNSLLSLNPK